MNHGTMPRRRKRDRRRGLGASERRPRLERVLEPRGLEDVEKPLSRSVTAENDAPGSPLPAIGVAPRDLWTPGTDPKAPIPYELTPAGELAVEQLRDELGDLHAKAYHWGANQRPAPEIGGGRS